MPQDSPNDRPLGLLLCTKQLLLESRAGLPQAPDSIKPGTVCVFQASIPLLIEDPANSGNDKERSCVHLHIANIDVKSTGI